jgi:aldose 1-epimerase
VRGRLVAVVVAAGLFAAGSLLEGSGRVAAAAGVVEAAFGTTPDGTGVRIFTLTNDAGMEVRAISYGAILVSIKVPDRSGRLGDVVVGHDTLDGYLTRSRFFGALVGRYGNRIAGGQFTLDGQTYTLAKNNGPNHLHGGVRGFDKVVWHGRVNADNPEPSVTFTRTSPDGEEGYPGNLAAAVTYTVTSRNELVIDYHATTDRPTVVNLTNHSYFNLAGEGNGDILSHQVTIDSDHYTPVDAGQIPTGVLAPVAGTPFDFTKPAAVGARIDGDHEQLQIGTGYDHNFVLRRSGPGLVHAARVVDPSSGRALDVRTTEPGLQFYTGNKLDGSYNGKSGHVYGKRSALCLETQHFPDSPNKPNFPSSILEPGKEYRTTTVFTFGVAR